MVKNSTCVVMMQLGFWFGSCLCWFRITGEAWYPNTQYRKSIKTQGGMPDLLDLEFCWQCLGVFLLYVRVCCLFCCILCFVGDYLLTVCLFCCIQCDVPLCFVGDQLPALCFFLLHSVWCAVVFCRSVAGCVFICCCVQFDVLFFFCRRPVVNWVFVVVAVCCIQFNVLLCFAGDQSSAAVLHCAPCGGRFTTDEAGRGQPCLHLSAGHLQDGKKWRPKMHKAVNRS